MISGILGPPDHHATKPYIRPGFLRVSSLNIRCGSKTDAQNGESVRKWGHKVTLSFVLRLRAKVIHQSQRAFTSTLHQSRVRVTLLTVAWKRRRRRRWRQQEADAAIKRRLTSTTALFYESKVASQSVVRKRLADQTMVYLQFMVEICMSEREAQTTALCRKKTASSSTR